ncbi:Pro-neuropeptide Y [Gossypium arboreum]|uniref:Pro-neuropeptide Y n=1 Tax=Gossypium arboreum TaxID=29729 RepID=A0A0B0PGI4_GOSAR|nr:Pro-neuropeptide Y [Gossypium arboreum]
MLKLGKTMCHKASSGIEDYRRSIHTLNLTFWVPITLIFCVMACIGTWSFCYVSYSIWPNVLAYNG